MVRAGGDARGCHDRVRKELAAGVKGVDQAGWRLDSERIEPFVDIPRLFAKKCHHRAFPWHIAKKRLFQSECHHRTRAPGSRARVVWQHAERGPKLRR